METKCQWHIHGHHFSLNRCWTGLTDVYCLWGSKIRSLNLCTHWRAPVMDKNIKAGKSCFLALFLQRTTYDAFSLLLTVLLFLSCKQRLISWETVMLPHGLKSSLEAAWGRYTSLLQQLLEFDGPVLGSERQWKCDLWSNESTLLSVKGAKAASVMALLSFYFFVKKFFLCCLSLSLWWGAGSGPAE